MRTRFGLIAILLALLCGSISQGQTVFGPPESRSGPWFNPIAGSNETFFTWPATTEAPETRWFAQFRHTNDSFNTWRYPEWLGTRSGGLDTNGVWQPDLRFYLSLPSPGNQWQLRFVPWTLPEFLRSEPLLELQMASPPPPPAGLPAEPATTIIVIPLDDVVIEGSARKPKAKQKRKHRGAAQRKASGGLRARP